MGNRTTMLILIAVFLVFSPIAAMLFSKIKKRRTRLIVGLSLAVVAFIVLALAGFAGFGTAVFGVLGIAVLMKRKDADSGY